MYPFNGTDDDDGQFSDDVGILKQALYVEFPEDFDPSKVPESGEEYLHHVIYERMHCEEWTVADFDRDKYRNSQTFKIHSEHEDCHKSAFLPSTEWQDNKLKAFQEFRRFVLYKLANRSFKLIDDFNEQRFISDITQDEVKPLFSKIISYTLHVKNEMLSALVEHLNTLPKGNSINSVLAVWLYALLSSFEIPLKPDTFSCLRNLARVCKQLRSNLATDAAEDLYAPLNLFICIVGRHYLQYDLADPYN